MKPLWGLGAVALLCLGGVVSILAKHGAFDFQTYHFTAGLVLEGKLAEIYRLYLPPNRYIYAPGLAVWLSPLGLVSRSTAFWVWTVFQIAVILAVAWGWMERTRLKEPEAYAFAVLAPLIFARPIIYILVYGTIDFFLFAACFWALLSRVDDAPSRKRTIFSWAVLTLLAIGKPMVAPLLVVPWIAIRAVDRRVLEAERIGQALGVLAAVLPVWLVLGFGAGSRLHGEWIFSLIGRGMPFDTQNQSLAAFMFRWFTDRPAGVLALGTGPHVFGFGWLSSETVEKLASTWTCLALAAGLGWQIFGRRHADAATWVAVLLAWILIPSHIAWKAYFVFGIPAAGLALAHAARAWSHDRRWLVWILVACFAAINLTTLDFIGRWGQAYTEALSILFWAYLAIIVVSLNCSQSSPKRTFPSV